MAFSFSFHRSSPSLHAHTTLLVRSTAWDAVASPAQFGSLTRLRLRGNLLPSSDALAALLQCAPRLRDLVLIDCDRVSTFSGGVLDGVCGTLERLCLVNTRQPPAADWVDWDSDSTNPAAAAGAQARAQARRGWQLDAHEMENIARCKRLRELVLFAVVALDAFARHPYEQRPCAVLPRLECLRYKPYGAFFADSESTSRTRDVMIHRMLKTL